MPHRRPRSGVIGLATSAGLLLAPGTNAAGSGFDGPDNVAIYWGQNSFNQGSGDLAQQRLSTYCANTNIDIIPMAFMVQITSGQGGEPTINFANQQNNCTVFPDSGLLDCPDIGDDIKTCQQKYGKTILLSIGGATYTEGGFADKDAAIAAANLVWDTFGPVSGSSDSSSSIAPSSTKTPSMIGSAHSTTTGNSTKGSAETTRSTKDATTTMAPQLPTGLNSTSLEKGNTANNTATLTKEASITSDIEILTLVTTMVTMLVPLTSVIAATDSTASADILSSSLNSAHAHEKVQNIGTVYIGTTSSPSTHPHEKTLKTMSTKTRTTTTTSASPTPETLSYATTHGRRQAKALRPFHDAVIDGFDLDLETTVRNFNPFANHLRTLMDGDKSKKYYLTAAPQCPYPDAADDNLLNGGAGVAKVKFDAIFVQFYNNFCGTQSFLPNTTTQMNFNFDTWNTWATTKSANPAVKVFLGVPAGQTAAGSGYTDPAGLKPIIEYCKTFSSFGGVMAWDVSQAYANEGFLKGVKAALMASKKRARAVRRVAGREWWG